MWADLSRRGKLLLGLLGVGVLAVGGFALAAWLAGGTGEGSARATSAENLVVESATVADTLYPGADGTVAVKISNPNDYPVSVTEISQTQGEAITSSAGAACDNSTGVTYTTQTSQNEGDDLPKTIAANGNVTLQLDDAVHMSNASDNSCQGATFTIPLTVTGASAAE